MGRLLEPVGVEPQGASNGEGGGVIGGGVSGLLDDQLTVLQVRTKREPQLVKSTETRTENYSVIFPNKLLSFPQLLVFIHHFWSKRRKRCAGRRHASLESNRLTHLAEGA